MQPHTDRLVVIGDVPRLKEPPSVCLSKGNPDLGDCVYSPDPFSAEIRDRSRDEAKAAGVQFIDPSRWLCFRKVCPSVIGSWISYRDTGHLSTPYARALAGPLAKALGLAPSRRSRIRLPL